MSTIAPADAVERWYRELAAAHTDEEMFIGQVGAALVHSQLPGFWLFTGHPDLPRLHALAHFLGRVEVFEPFRRFAAPGPTGLRDVTVHLPHLRFPADGGLAFTATAVGSQEPDGWTVQVTMATAAGAAAALSMLYLPEPVAGLGEVAVPDLPPADPPRARSGRFSWAQLAIGPIRWQGGPSGERAALLPAVTAADLWTAVFPPSHDRQAVLRFVP